jgi:hypothetical protein
LWTEASGIVDLGTLGGNYSAAMAINDNGMAVGVSTTANNVKHVPAGAGCSGEALTAPGKPKRTIAAPQERSAKKLCDRAGALDAIPFFTSDSTFRPTQDSGRNWGLR